MKKIFILAASVLASVSMMAQVDFQYLPTVDDQPTGVEAPFGSDKVKVPAGTVLAEGTNFTVKNAYETTYKAVGMMTDTAYCQLQLGDVTVDYRNERIQGQDNPTAGGGNPVLEMKAPNAGACYLVEVKADGWLYVAVKTTPNKQQFVFESVVNNEGNVAGTMVGYQYLMQANKENGTMSVEFVGDAELNQLMAPPAMPYTYFTDKSFSTNGVGVLAVRVYKDGSPYIVGTAGSKMMACGFGWSAEEVEVKAIGLKNYTDKEGNAQNYEDVVLSDKTAETYKTITLDEAPFFVKAQMPKNESELDSTKNIWNKAIDDGKGGIKAANKMYAKMWGVKKDGTTEEGRMLEAAKSGSNFVFQIDGMKEYNIILSADAELSDIENHQTVEITGLDDDLCVRVGDVPESGKCDAIILDCLTGDEIKDDALENVIIEQESDKFIKDGHLYIRNNGVIYNAVGSVVK